MVVLLVLLVVQEVYLDRHQVVQVDLKQQQVATVVLLTILQLKEMMEALLVEQLHQAQVVVMDMLL